MPQPIIYEIDLRDLLSQKVAKADEHVEHLEGSLERTKGILGELGGMLGTGFAVFEGFEFLKDALKDFEKADDALAQLKAGIKSTGGVAGVTLEDMEEQALKFSEAIPRSKAEMEDLQSILLTFPAITKNSFEDVSLTIADMSQRLHNGLEETAIQVGKALQDPVKGITALRRVGVNFNEAQTEVIKNLVATGKSAKAQQLILHELNVEFGGSSAEAAKTFSGQMHILSNEFEEQKEKLGELIADGLEALRPEIKGLIEDLGESIDWLKEHKDQIFHLIELIGTVTKYYIAWKLAVKGIHTAVDAFFALKKLNAWMMGEELIQTKETTLAINEQTAAVINLTAANDAYSRSAIGFNAANAAVGAEAGAAMAGTAGVEGAAAVEGATASEVGAAAVTVVAWGAAAIGALALLWNAGSHGQEKDAEELAYEKRTKELWPGPDPDKIDSAKLKQRALTDDEKAYGAAAYHLNSATGEHGLPAHFGFPDTPPELLKQIKENTKETAKHAANNKPAGGGSGVNKVHGNNPVNINIKIERLSDIKVETTNINESYGKIKDHVTKALTDAINDSQLIAER